MDLYERPENTLTAEQLDFMYNPNGDGQHPRFTREHWRTAVAEQDTISGYWVWVVHMIRME